MYVVLIQPECGFVTVEVNGKAKCLIADLFGYFCRDSADQSFKQVVWEVVLVCKANFKVKSSQARSMLLAQTVQLPTDTCGHLGGQLRPVLEHGT